MKIAHPAGLALVAAVSFCALEARAQNLIRDGGFELGPGGTPFDSPPGGGSSNNIGVVPAFWVVTGGLSNLQQGTAAGDGGVALAPYNGAYSGLADGAGGNHFFDGTASTQQDGRVTITQAFTISSVTPVSGTFALGVRDLPNPSRGLGFSVLTIASSDPGSTFAPFTLNTAPVTAAAAGTWTVNNFSLAAVPAGNYTISFNLADGENLDAVAITAVPEPSTWAMALGGLGTMLLFRRRHSRRLA